MGPLPKRKFSVGRTHRRRAHHALTPVLLVTCSHCSEKHLPHTVCPSCGFYRNREVVRIEKEAATKE